MSEKISSEGSELSNNEKQFGFGDIVQYEGIAHVITSIEGGLATIMNVMDRGDIKVGVKLHELSEGGYGCEKKHDITLKTECEPTPAICETPNNIQEYTKTLIELATLAENPEQYLRTRHVRYEKDGAICLIETFDQKTITVRDPDVGGFSSYTYEKFEERFRPLTSEEKEKLEDADDYYEEEEDYDEEEFED